MIPELCSFLIYASLGGLYFVALHAICVRLLMVDRRWRRCSDALFCGIRLGNANTWKDLQADFERLDRQALGWLSELRSASNIHNAVALCQSILERSETYLDLLRLAASLASLLGLMGTVSAFLVSDDVDDLALSTAFTTTLLGISISIPPTIYITLTRRRRESLADQIEVFQEHLETIAFADGARSTQPKKSRNHQTPRSKRKPEPLVRQEPPSKKRSPVSVSDAQACDYIVEADQAELSPGDVDNVYGSKNTERTSELQSCGEAAGL